MKNHNAIRKSPVKLTAYFEEYERYGPGGLVILHVTRKNAKEAVTTLISNMGLYADDFEDLLIGANEGITDPLQVLRSYLQNSTNGDGCDFVYLIRNDTTGETIFEDDELFEERTV